jgi:acetylglutamate kinase
MKKSVERAELLMEALPYIQLFKNKTIVVKYGGSAMGDDDTVESILLDITLLKYVGMHPIIVHGGGIAVNEMLSKLNVESKFHNGLRITDDDTIDVAAMVLIGQVNTNLVSMLNKMGAQAVGLSGISAKLIEAEKMAVVDGIDLGHVGHVTKINVKLLEAMMKLDYIPVIAPIGIGPDGEKYNINADTAAGEVAAALKAEKIVFMTDVDGIQTNPKDPKTLLSRFSASQGLELIEKGVVQGGMLPKLQACMRAVESGVDRAHIINGNISHSLLLEVFTDTGIGTMVNK